jgi:tetratricopeptide (TPR) repeat protein
MPAGKGLFLAIELVLQGRSRLVLSALAIQLASLLRQRASASESKGLNWGVLPLISTGADFIPIPVSPGDPSLKIPLLVEACNHLLSVGGDKDELAELATKLERSKPSCESEWRSIVDTFVALDRRAGIEIVCERYLHFDRNNVTVLLYLGRHLSSIFHHRTRATAIAKAIASQGSLSEANVRSLAVLLRSVKAAEAALQIYRNLLKKHPDDYEAQYGIVTTCLEVGNLTRGAREFRKLRSILPRDGFWNVTAAGLAVNFSDRSALLQHGQAARKRLRSVHVDLVARLVRYYVLGGVSEKAEEFLIELTDLSTNDHENLKKVLELALYYRFQTAVQAITRHLNSDSAIK